MIRDPVYRAILERLGETLDPDTFERVIPGLLPPELGSAVPVPGGADAGFDGAIIDGEGEPYPVVCTTGEDVIGNLRASLQSHVAAGFPRRRAVVATSQELSNQRCQNLYEAARELGFELMGVFHRPMLAELLYHHPAARLELLGIPGDPPALSVLPPPGRYPVSVDLIARDEDLAWLRRTPGDRVVVGVPGSGKTALVQAMAATGEALFVRRGVPNDRLFDEIRAQQTPLPALIVDDSNLELELLVRLRTARADTGIEFDIIATTWPGSLEAVADNLGIDQQGPVRTLDLLTRNEIRELYSRLGVVAPDDNLMRELIDQASNRPGLAVTIASLWQQGAWEEVVRGKALSGFAGRTVRALGGEGLEVLAALAIGGRAGMSLAAISEVTGEPQLKVRRVLTDLGAAGVISERGGAAYAVEPWQLRSALLAEVFFNRRPNRLRYQQYYLRAESRTAAATAIVECLSRGGELSPAEAQRIVEETADATVWGLYAHRGRDEALWVLENFPGDLVEVAPSTLNEAPEATLERLLKQAAPVPDSVSSAPSHPLRVIRDWARSLEYWWHGPELGVRALRRRELLTHALCQYAGKGGDRQVAGQVAGFVLDPVLESWSSDPASGMSVTLRSMVAPVEVLDGLATLWDELRSAIGVLDGDLWPGIVGSLHLLAAPQAPAGGIPTDQQEESARSLARLVVSGLLELAEGHPGFLRALGDLARDLDMPAVVSAHHAYDAVFAPRPGPGFHHGEWAEEQRAVVEALAAEWSQRPPASVAKQLADLCAEARAVGHTWPDNSIAVVQELADRTNRPELWLEAFSAEPLVAWLAGPFLQAAVRSRREGWQDALRNALNDASLEVASVKIALTEPGVPQSLRDAAIRQASYHVEQLEGWALRNELEIEVLDRILREGPPAAALSVAVGHWQADPQGEVNQALAVSWRQVILRTRGRERAARRTPLTSNYWLGKILAGDPKLAFEWLRIELQEPDPSGLRLLDEREVCVRAIDALPQDARRQLLEDAAIDDPTLTLVRHLVGDDDESYRTLLGRNDCAFQHLAPLGRMPDRQWWSLVRVALDAGKTSEEVVHASLVYGSSVMPMDPDASEWSSWERAFVVPDGLDEPRLDEVARIGQEQLKRRRSDARRHRRGVEMNGVP